MDMLKRNRLSSYRESSFIEKGQEGSFTKIITVEQFVASIYGFRQTISNTSSTFQQYNYLLTTDIC